MKKLIILFLSVLLFSCCPCEKKIEQTAPTEKEEAKSNNIVKIDSSRFKAISNEKGADDIPDAYLKKMERYFKEEWGPV